MSSNPSVRRRRAPVQSPSRALHLECLEERKLLSATALGDERLTTAGRWIVSLDNVGGPRGGQRDTATQLVTAAGLSSQVSVVRNLGADGLFLFDVSADLPAQKVPAALQELPGFRFAEPDTILSIAATPNDPSFGQLYGLHNTGQLINGDPGTLDADIDAVEAWNTTTGSSNVVVGVIDTGIDYTHPDLVDNIWTNPGEVAGNGIDDDANGYVDDVHGYDFINFDSNPIDDNSHGTHVAGTIGGVGNNGVGIVGVNWDVSLMALKFLGAGGSGPTSAAVEALNYVSMMSDRGVNIRATNNSWGGGGFDSLMVDAIEGNRVRDILFIAAAGNFSQNNDFNPFYPASYTLDNVISVAATDNDDNLAGFSHYGLTSVDLAAPGVNVLSSVPGGYAYFNGTSMATPHVTGAAALAFATRPTATYTEVRDAIFNGVDPKAGLTGLMVTGGRLNLVGMLNEIGMRVIGSTPADGSVVTTAPTEFGIDFSELYDPASVQATDLTVNGIAADSFAFTDPDTLTFHYNSTPVTSQGQQSMAIAGGAILRAADADPVDPFDSIFYYDSLLLQVVSTNPPLSGGAFTLPSPLIYDVTFNEPIDPLSVQPSDLSLAGNGGPIANAVTVLPGNTTARFTIDSLATAEGTLAASIAAGAITDVFGNPGAAFSASYALDFGTTPYPVPLDRKRPLGSLVYDPPHSASVQFPGDIDSYTIDLDPGQVLTVLVAPVGSPATLAPTVEIRDPSSVVVGSASAGAGLSALVQNLAVTTGGTYTISVGGATGSTGSYILQLTLNAALEEEGLLAGASNDSLATAQDIDASFIAIGASASFAERGAVLGTVDFNASLLAAEVEPNDTLATANSAVANFVGLVGSNIYQLGLKGNVSPSGDLDYYNLGLLQAGDVITITQSGSSSLRGSNGDTVVELYRGPAGSPVFVTANDDGGPGADSLIYRFTVTETDTYYIDARGYSGNPGNYDLGIFLENAGTAPTTGGVVTTEAEPNGTAATATNVATSWRQAQYLSRTSGDIAEGDSDFFAYQFTAGDLVTVNIDSTSGLAAQVLLSNSVGTAIASENGQSLFGDSPVYAFIIPATGTYFVNVLAAFGTGTYNADVYLSSNTPPPIPTPSTADFYSFSLNAGDTATVLLESLSGGPVNFSLIDPSGATIAASLAGPTNVNQTVNELVVPVAGTYRVQVGGYSNTNYNLVVVRNAGFDTEANDTIGTAQPVLSTQVAGEQRVLGHVVGTSTLYGANRAGQLFTIDLSTGAGTPVGSLPFNTTEFEFNSITHRAFAQASDGSFYGQAFDINTGAGIGGIVLDGASFTGMEWVESSLYATAITSSGGPSTLRILNPVTGTSTVIGPTGFGPISGLAFDPSFGIMYGITGGATGNLLTINLATGAATLVGSTGFRAGSLEIGPDGLLYGGGTGSDAGKFFRVNPASGASDLVGLTGIGGPGIADITGLALVSTGSDSDWYSVNAAGPGTHLHFETSTPGDGPNQPVNRLDPWLRLFDAAGNELAADDNSAPDGRNAVLDFTVPAGGVYFVEVSAGTSGEYVLSIVGNTPTQPAFQVAATNPSDGTLLAAQPTTVTVDFNDAVFAPSVQSSDLTIDGVLTATGVTQVDGNTFNFTIPGGLAAGIHTLGFAAGSVLDVQQTPLVVFSSTFTVDNVGPRVAATWIAPDAVKEPGSLSYTVTFDEPMNVGNLSSDDFSLHGNYRGVDYAAGSFSFDPTGRIVTLNYTNLPDDNYTLTLVSGSGNFTDVVGNILDGEFAGVFPSGNGVSGGNFVIGFSMDLVTEAYPTPLIPSKPFGSLLFGSGHFQSARLLAISGASGTASTLYELDPANGTVLQTIGATGMSHLTDIDVDPITGEVYGVNNNTRQLVKVDRGTGIATVVGTTNAQIPDISFRSDGTLFAWVENGAGGSDDLATIDLTTGAVTIIPSPIGSARTGLAFDSNDNLYVKTDVLYRVNPLDGSVISAVSLSGFTHNVLEFGPDDVLYTAARSSNGGPSTLQTIDVNTGHVTDLGIVAGVGITGLAFDSGGFVRAIAYDGDEDSFTLAVDAGQTISIVVTPLDGGLQPTIEMRDPSSAVVGTATALAAGQKALLNSIVAASNGTYTITVGGAAGTTGLYSVQVTLNAALEEESHDGSTNDSFATAQNIDASAVGLLGAASRYAVVGRTETNTGDWYTLNLTAGDTATLLLETLAGGTADVALYDPSSVLLASSSAGPSNVDRIISHLVAPVSGSYLLLVTGTSDTDYNLVVVRNVAFDTEENDAFATAQDITGEEGVLGHTGGDADWYSFSVNAGDNLDIQTSTPGAGPGEFVNVLNPRIELYDPSNHLVGSGVVLGDGKNERILNTAAVTGLYRLRVVGEGGTSGEYFASVGGATGTSAPAFQVAATNPPDGTSLAAQPTIVTVDFIDAVYVPSLDSADLMINGVLTATDVTQVDGNTFEFAIPGGLGAGTHTLSFAAGSILDIQQTPLAAFSSTFIVDDVGPRVEATSIVPGGAVAPGGLSYQVTFDEPMNVGNLSSDDFSLHGNYRGGDYAAGSFAFDLTGRVVTLNYANLPDDNYTLTLVSGSGNFTDAVGNILDGEFAGVFPSGNGVSGGNFVIEFSMDLVTETYPTPLVAKAPLGSLVYDPSLTRVIAFGGDTDHFTLAVDAGQTISIVVTPLNGGLQPTIEVRDPSSVALGTTTALAGGQKALLNTVAAASGGTYTIIVGGAAGTTGLYTVQVMLNAALEEESNDGTTNDSRATAQDINGSFIAVGTTLAPAQRGAVTGTADGILGALPNEIEPNNTLDTANSAALNFAPLVASNTYQLGIKGNVSPASDLDFYNIGQLQNGDIITISQSGSGSLRGINTNPLVELYRGPSGAPILVASDDNSGPGNDAFVFRFTVTDTDTYYIKARASASGTYDLGIFLENAGTAPTTGGVVTTETEPNNTAATATNVSTSWRQAQFFSRTAGAITPGDSDTFTYHFTAGDLVTINLDSLSALDARVVFRSSTRIVAFETGDSLPNDAPVYSLIIPTTDTYSLIVQQVTGTTGTGAYHADVYLSTNTPPPAAVPGYDFFSFSLNAGEATTLALNNLAGAGNLNLVLQDSAGATLATGLAGATNLDLAISNFVAPATGTYYARVGGNAGAAYNLVATRNSAFDTEGNDSFDTAQDISGTHGVLGHIGGNTVHTVGYYTDFNSFSIGPEAPILAAGFTPIHIFDISTFDLSTIDVLLVNESNNAGLSSELLGRLSAIELWVQAGGIFMVHDRYVGPDGVPAHNPFLIGAPGALSLRDFTFGPDLDVIPPGGTLVTNGPHGIITNTSLDGGGYSDHGWVQGSSLPLGSTRILSAGPNASNVAALSYLLGSGSVYYSTIPLDAYLGGSGSLSENLTTIYTPNVLAYLSDAASGSAEDWFSIHVPAAGSYLRFESRTPGDGPGQFDNGLDPHIELYDPSGALIASGVTLGDGRNEIIQIASASVAGDYRVRLTVEGNRGEYFLAATVADVAPPSTVAGRRLFYNDSGSASPLVFDGADPAINANDDFAIATDKTAYLPGAGPATFANVSSYSKGINGIMVDIAGFHGAITASDFTFKIGNSNAPSGWVQAPDPIAVSVRVGAGVGLSDRVEIVWDNGAIVNTWLEVIVAANENTGLASPDIFFFGNRIGDIGTGAATYFVTNAADDLAARSHPGVTATVSNLFDFNRDGVVNATDQIISRTNHGILTKIDISNPPATPQVAPAGLPEAELSAVASALAIAGLPGMPANASHIGDPLPTPGGNLSPMTRNLVPLAQGRTPQSRAVLVATDSTLETLDVDDVLLDTLLGDLGGD